MRALAALLAALVLAGCGGGEAETGPTETAPWRLVYAAETPGRPGLDVYVVDVPGGEPRRVAGVPGRDDFSPAWSPDGRTIAYRLNPPRGDEGEILVVPASGGTPRNLTRSPAVSDWSPAWHPSGRSLAFFSFPGERGDVWSMASDGTARRRLTRDGTLNEYPSYAPEGERLVFQSHRSGDFDVWTIDAGGRERNLTRHPANDKWPAWSDDGEWIAFVSDRDGAEDVFAMRPDGSGLVNLTRTPALYESHPAWAPDGRLTFSSHGESGPISLWVVDPEGGEPERLETAVEPVFGFDWLDP